MENNDVKNCFVKLERLDVSQRTQFLNQHHHDPVESNSDMKNVQKITHSDVKPKMKSCSVQLCRLQLCPSKQGTLREYSNGKSGDSENKQSRTHSVIQMQLAWKNRRWKNIAAKKDRCIEHSSTDAERNKGYHYVSSSPEEPEEKDPISENLNQGARYGREKERELSHDVKLELSNIGLQERAMEMTIAHNFNMNAQGSETLELQVKTEVNGRKHLSKKKRKFCRDDSLSKTGKEEYLEQKRNKHVKERGGSSTNIRSEVTTGDRDIFKCTVVHNVGDQFLSACASGTVTAEETRQKYTRTNEGMTSMRENESQKSQENATDSQEQRKYECETQSVQNLITRQVLVDNPVLFQSQLRCDSIPLASISLPQADVLNISSPTTQMTNTIMDQMPTNAASVPQATLNNSVLLQTSAGKQVPTYTNIIHQTPTYSNLMFTQNLRNNLIIVVPSGIANTSVNINPSQNTLNNVFGLQQKTHVPRSNCCEGQASDMKKNLNSGATSQSEISGATSQSVNLGATIQSLNSGTTSQSRNSSAAIQSVNSGATCQSVNSGATSQSVNSGATSQSMNSGAIGQSVNSGATSQLVNSGATGQLVNSGATGQSVNSGATRQSINANGFTEQDLHTDTGRKEQRKVAEMFTQQSDTNGITELLSPEGDDIGGAHKGKTCKKTVRNAKTRSTVNASAINKNIVTLQSTTNHDRNDVPDNKTDYSVDGALYRDRSSKENQNNTSSVKTCNVKCRYSLRRNLKPTYYAECSDNEMTDDDSNSDENYEEHNDECDSDADDVIKGTIVKEGNGKSKKKRSAVDNAKKDHAKKTGIPQKLSQDAQEILNDHYLSHLTVRELLHLKRSRRAQVEYMRKYRPTPRTVGLGERSHRTNTNAKLAEGTAARKDVQNKSTQKDKQQPQKEEQPNLALNTLSTKEQAWTKFKRMKRRRQEKRTKEEEKAKEVAATSNNESTSDIEIQELEQKMEKLDQEGRALEDKWRFMYGEEDTFQNLNDVQKLWRLCVYDDSEGFRQCFKYIEWNCYMRCIHCGQIFERFAEYLLHSFGGTKCSAKYFDKQYRRRQRVCYPCNKRGLTKHGWIRHMIKMKVHGERTSAYIPKLVFLDQIKNKGESTIKTDRSRKNINLHLESGIDRETTRNGTTAMVAPDHNQDAGCNSEETPRNEHSEETPRNEHSVETPRNEHSVETPRNEHSEETPRNEHSEETPRNEQSTPVHGHRKNTGGSSEETSKDEQSAIVHDHSKEAEGKTQEASKTRQSSVDQFGIVCRSIVEKEEEWLDSFEPGFQCIACTHAVIVFISLFDAVSHVKKAHFNDEGACFSYRWKQQFKGKEIIIVKRTTYPSEGYLCSLCGVSYRLEESLHRHLVTVHKDVPPKEFGLEDGTLLCPHCGRIYSVQRRQSFNQHLLVHSDPVTCPKCNQVCKNKARYRQHAKIHRDPIFTCKKCGKKFQNREGFAQHKVVPIFGTPTRTPTSKCPTSADS